MKKAEQAKQNAKLAANKKKNEAIREANSEKAVTAKNTKPAKQRANKKTAALSVIAESDEE